MLKKKNLRGFKLKELVYKYENATVIVRGEIWTKEVIETESFIFIKEKDGANGSEDDGANRKGKDCEKSVRICR
jgi:hypothetical protein